MHANVPHALTASHPHVASHQQHAWVNVSCFMPTGQARHTGAHAHPAGMKCVGQALVSCVRNHQQGFDRDMTGTCSSPQCGPQGRHSARPASTTPDPSTALQPVTAVTAARSANSTTTIITMSKYSTSPPLYAQRQQDAPRCQWNYLDAQIYRHNDDAKLQTISRQRPLQTFNMHAFITATAPQAGTQHAWPRPTG